MTFKKGFYLLVSAFIFLCLFSVHSAISEEASQQEPAIEKNKKEILSNIELFEHSLHTTKSCVSQAKTVEELEQCRIDEKATMKLQRAQDMMNEIGMSPEERRMHELRPEKGR